MARVLCVTCHDEENDVKWGKPGHDVADKWIGKGLIHRTKKDIDPAKVPEKKENPPEAKAGDPPLVIEVIEAKKK